MTIAVAYFVSIVGGWLATAVLLYVIRRTTGLRREFSTWMDFWLGGIERAIATTLVIGAPTLLPAFVGGWVAAKFAAHWQRASDDDVFQRSLVFLLGNAISFAVGIGVGLYFNPASLSLWQRVP